MKQRKILLIMELLTTMLFLFSCKKDEEPGNSVVGSCQIFYGGLIMCIEFFADYYDDYTAEDFCSSYVSDYGFDYYAYDSTDGSSCPAGYTNVDNASDGNLYLY